MLDGIFQLTYISRPGVVQHASFRIAGDAYHAASHFSAVLADEVTGQRWNILAALAQRRHLLGNYVEAVIQITAESALSGGFLQVAVGGGNQAHIELDGTGSANARELVLLQDPQQLGLKRRG